jgi:hypothetical protein
VRTQLARTFDVPTLRATKRAVLALPNVRDRGATLVRLLRGGGVKPETRPTAPASAARPAPAPDPAQGGERFRAALVRALETLGADVRAELAADPTFQAGDDVDQARHPKVRGAFSRALREVSK